MTHLYGKPNLTRLVAATSLVALVSCSSMPGGSEVPPPLKAAEGATLKMCGVIGARFEYPNTVLREAAPIAAGAVTLSGRPIAAHCQVSGRMFARKGVDGQDYAIGFEVRLPADWNGRFFHQVNGGIDGVVQPAYGPNTNSAGALAQGFAVITSRASYEMVQKAAMAGIGLLAAVSAPTVLAVRIAREAGVTLAGFVRGERCMVYADDAHRLTKGDDWKS